MTSAKRRRSEIKAKRRAREKRQEEKAKREALEARLRYVSDAVLQGAAPVNRDLIQPFKNDDPDFVIRGTYLDVAFDCVDCGKTEVWTSTQQKWWYEVARRGRETTAIRCRACRRKERERKSEARRVHLEGLVKKRAAQNDKS
jgi:Probable zinc-ribbon domain